MLSCSVCVETSSAGCHLQGIFRGLKDASTPLYATIACSALNIALEPAFIFEPLKLGVRGSALATALAQSLPLIALFMVLQRKYGLHLTKLLTRGLDWHSLGAMFAPTGFLLLRTVSISAVFATATSLVARAGPLAAAAHQVCCFSGSFACRRRVLRYCKAQQISPHATAGFCNRHYMLTGAEPALLREVYAHPHWGFCILYVHFLLLPRLLCCCCWCCCRLPFRSGWPQVSWLTA